MDEIVLSYVVSILEELGSEVGSGCSVAAAEEAFDLDEFCEMMAAYLPEFSIIQPAAVFAWMYELATHLGQSKKRGESEYPYSNISCKTYVLSLHVIFPGAEQEEG